MLTPDPPLFTPIRAWDAAGKPAPVYGVVFLTLVEADDYTSAVLRDRKGRRWFGHWSIGEHWREGEERGLAVSRDEFGRRVVKWRPADQYLPELA